MISTPGVQRWTAEKVESETESTRVLESARRWCFQSADLARSGVREDHTASYFSHDNVEATKMRDKLASDSLEMLIRWLKDGGNVGILGTTPGDPLWRCAHPVFLDATNSTRNRRQVSDFLSGPTFDG